MDQMTQQNAAMAEETMAATHVLNAESDGLAQLVDQFRLDRGGGEALAARKPGRIETLASPALRCATHDGSGVLRKPLPARKEEIWENF